MDSGYTETTVNEGQANAVVEPEEVQHNTGQSYNAEEQEIIRMFTQSRLAHKEDVEYINFDDYEVPPPAQFPQLAKPSVSIKYPHMTFSMSSIKLFDGVYHVLPLIAKKRKRICILPLAQEELSSFQWARLKGDRNVNRSISAPGFLNDLFYRMKWSRRVRYRAYGQIVNSPRGLALAFDLDQSSLIPGTTTEFIDPKTGRKKKRMDVYLPDQYKGHMGMDYNDYVNSKQISLFDDFPELMTKTYGDVPAELLDENIKPEEN